MLVSCGGRAERPPDPVPDVPAAQQRDVTRREFGLRWPFTVAHGTLACVDQAVVFRSAGVTYALNEAARARGFAPADEMLQPRHPPPTRPLARLPQGVRARIFAAVAACGTVTPAASDTAGARCRARLAAAEGLSADELEQIDVEGHERFWRPLPAPRQSVVPIVEAGLRLCPR
jgi:hypothetical protein